MSVSERLKRARTALKLKQDEMSARTGIPIDTYKKYEGGTGSPVPMRSRISFKPVSTPTGC